MGIRFRGAELFGVAVAAIAVTLWVNDWLGGACLVVLWFGVRLLLTDDRIPVLAAAFCYEWMQVSIGIFYSTATGRPLLAQTDSDYRPMVLIGLGTILALAAGLRIGIHLIRDERENRVETQVAILTMPALATCYVISVISEGALLSLTVTYPSLRQILVTLTVVRLGLLFLVLRRLAQPVFRVTWFTAVLVTEVVLGLTGYFAGFREPLVLSSIVLFEIFDSRRTMHWVALTTLVSFGALLAVMWMGVRTQYRREVDIMDPLVGSRTARVDRINSLAGEFFSNSDGQFRSTADALVDRMWTIYYPALAIARVPATIAHTGGEILTTAMLHVVTPRVFFPDKARVMSDSEKVKKYSGVFVAGENEGTSIAFGYAAESYVDFGVPVMFAPVFVFGLVLGAIYAWFLRSISHRELAVAVVIVVFWLSLYLFERSWANMMGMCASLVMYLGIPIVFLDRMISARTRTIPRFDPESRFQYSDANVP